MAVIKTKGLILRESNMGEYDKMCTILTPDVGKIGVAAKGSRRSKSTLMAGTQLLCFSDLIIYSGPSSYNLNQAEPIEAFYNIRNDLDKLSYASHIAKIVSDVTDENQFTYKILQLTLNTLYLISETDEDKDLILAVFQLKLMHLLGFTPHVTSCVNCGKKEDISHFSIRDSGYICKDCARQDPSAIKMIPDTYNAINYIIKADIKKVYSFKISEEGKKELELISNLYLNTTLDKNYKLIKY